MLVAAVAILVALSLVCAGVTYLSWKNSPQTSTGNNPNFVAFQRKYFSAYFLALVADWLQGPYLYKLYSHYGFLQAQIAVLYVFGLASAVIFGTWAPFIANSFGRRNLCILFTVIYSISCLLKLSRSYLILILGRIFGGVATSLLFSSYEAWYIHEHINAHDFPREWISVTMRKISVWNGSLAAICGVLANLLVDGMGAGPVAPFVFAIPFLLISGIVITLTWSENYGQGEATFRKACAGGLREIVDNTRLLLLGAVQSLYESVLHIVIFLWTPVLSSTHSQPLGVIFSTFMVCIMIGSASQGIASRYISSAICLVMAICLAFAACVTLAASSVQGGEIICFSALLVYEISVGIYFAAVGKLREEILPESHTVSIMNWFRVPLNMIACVVLLLLHDESFRHGNRLIFEICCVLLCGALFSMGRLLPLVNKKSDIEEPLPSSAVG